MTDDSANDSAPSFPPSGSKGETELVEETLGRLQRTLQRINVGAPQAAPPNPDAPDADVADTEALDGETLAPTGSGDAESAGGDGLARLVLTLVQLLHDVLERQAIRRMENDTLTPDEVERIGQALMKQAAEIRRICEAFGIDPKDLDLDLGTVHVDDPSA
jgi:hypothetical protein